jgi:hypothetical protein
LAHLAVLIFQELVLLMVVKFKASFHQLKLDFRVELMNFILIIDLILANFIDDFN